MSAVRRVGVAGAMTLRQLLRDRVAVLLFFVVPALFYAIIVLTTTDDPIAFQLASVGDDVVVQVGKQAEALVFIGLAAVGLLSAFLGMNLLQRDHEAHLRLVLCGYRPAELLLAKLLVLAGLVVAISAWVASALPIFFTAERLGLVVAGFCLVGWVYGCYGLLVGALFRRNLEGILFVVLLANIDAGWLQNPIYYADAQNQAIIRGLPAYLPSQVSMAAAFTTHPVGGPALGAAFYGAALLLAALAVHSLRLRRR